MTKLRFWIAPLIVFVILLFVVGITAYWFDQGQKTHELEKSNQISYFISKNISREIENRLQALKVVSRLIKKEPSKSEFLKFAQFLRTEYSGFFAINFVNPKGTIQIVYPEKENQAALGRNLINERPELRGYLLDAKAAKEPRASHRIMTYQKIYAVVLYVPLFGNSDNFIGWLNGVFYLDHALTNFMENENFANVSARVRWHHPADTNTVSYKWNDPIEFQTTDYRIMNQTISIDVALGSTPLEQRRNQLYVMTLVLRILLLFIIIFLVIKLTLSRISLSETNRKLAFSNKMLTSLSHDISTPLTSLQIAIQIAIKDSEITGNAISKIMPLVKTIQDMFKSVRILQSFDIGAKSIPVESVSALAAITNAISTVEVLAEAKRISFEISDTLNDRLMVKADLHTLVNNVLLNVLSNSIKFSNSGGKVKIDSRIVGEKVMITFINDGKSISPENMEKLRRSMAVDSEEGTDGEPGTGLGLLQISGFMKMYGGEMSFENEIPTGTKLTLSFQKA